MKDTFYFTHDYNARSDEKITELLSKHGMEGYGIFWGIIESLYNNANALQTHYDRIAYELHTDVKIVESVINDFGLFSIKDGFFGSVSIGRRLTERNDKSVKARESAFKRWEKCERNADALKNDANAMLTECEGNAIKERKVKERKLKEIKIRKENLKENKSGVTEKDFIGSVIDKFKIAFPDYVITNLGKERSMAAELVGIYGKKYPDADTEQTLKALGDYFRLCSTITETWYKNNMSLSLMVSKYNEINNILINGKSKGTGASDKELFELIAGKIGVTK